MTTNDFRECIHDLVNAYLAFYKYFMDMDLDRQKLILKAMDDRLDKLDKLLDKLIDK